MLIHRLNFLQVKNPCRENLFALINLNDALKQLTARTAARQARGVEGRAVV